MMVYLASDRPLFTIAWDEANPGFYVFNIEDDRSSEPVRGQFVRPYVYYLGAYRGCGCEFQYGIHNVEADDPTEWAAATEARRGLVTYLTAALIDQPAVDLYACWSGDEAAKPDHHRRLSLVDLFCDQIGFREREFLTVVQSDLSS